VEGDLEAVGAKLPNQRVQRECGVLAPLEQRPARGDERDAGTECPGEFRREPDRQVTGLRTVGPDDHSVPGLLGCRGGRPRSELRQQRPRRGERAVRGAAQQHEEPRPRQLLGLEEDLDLDLGSHPANLVLAQLTEHTDRRRVTREHRCAEAHQALLPRAVGQPVEQPGAKAATLPVVGDDDRGLCLVGPGPHEARDADDVPRRLVDREQRFVVVVVDLGEVVQVALAEPWRWTEEAPVAGFRAQTLESGMQRVTVIGRDGPQDDDGAVRQRDAARRHDQLTDRHPRPGAGSRV